MKASQKFLSLLLAGCMLLGLANLPAYAEASLAPTQAPKALSVPNSMNTILEDGFEDYKVIQREQSRHKIVEFEEFDTDKTPGGQTDNKQYRIIALWHILNYSINAKSCGCQTHGIK